MNGKTAEIDARTSDAVAIAVRFNCPIYCYEFIIETAGVSGEEDTGMQLDDPEMDIDQVEATPDVNTSIDDLKRQLDAALTNEEYEKASQLRDEINKREGGE